MDIFEVIGETVVSAVLFIGETAGEAVAEKIAGSNAVSRFPLLARVLFGIAAGLLCAAAIFAAGLLCFVLLKSGKIILGIIAACVILFALTAYIITIVHTIKKFKKR